MSVNLFPRSGFVTSTSPAWVISGSVARGDDVYNADAPEVGVELEAAGSVGVTNHVTYFECPVGSLIKDKDYFVSFIVKAGTKDWAFIRENANDSGGSRRSYFDLANREVGSHHYLHDHTFIQHLGDDVVRIGLHFTAEEVDSATQRTITLGAADDNSDNDFDGTDGEVLLEIFHAQLEPGAYPTPPITKVPDFGHE